MKHKLGTVFMILGALLVLSAAVLFLHNRQEENAAEESVRQVLPRILEQIPSQPPTQPPEEYGVPLELLDPSAFVMKEVEINGYGYIGYLSIPVLGLELPIMADWDYTRLQIAPCRYTGSVRSEDLVLMAHNYSYHFGKLSQLSPGDMVMFTDMEGNITRYQVVVLDVLHPTAVEEMTSGEFDLTLFTCTYGGKSRVTVCCDKIGWTEQNQ